MLIREYLAKQTSVNLTAVRRIFILLEPELETSENIKQQNIHNRKGRTSLFYRKSVHSENTK